MEFPSPRLKGFAIELPLSKYAVNVQDGNKQFVAGAKVKVTGINFAESGVTNNKGCYFGSAELHKTYTMVILKPGFTTWTHRFILMLSSAFSNPLTKNFPLIVRNSAGTAISGASVAITSPKPHSDSGTTAGTGLYEGLIEKDYLNSITISKAGFQTYVNDFSHYLQITCYDDAFVAVPVITLIP